MGNREEIERLLGNAEALLVEARALQEAAHGNDPTPAVADWRSRAGPAWGELSSRLPKLLASLGDEEYSRTQSQRLEDLREQHSLTLRHLARFEQERTHRLGSPGFERLRELLLDEAEALEQRFEALEKGPFDETAVKQLEFEGRISTSALERRVGQGLKGMELEEALGIKKLMSQVRDLLKGGVSDLRRYLKGEMALSARRRFQAPEYGMIPAGVIAGSRPFPHDSTGKSGLFYEAYENGQLKLLARLQDGKTVRYLRLFAGGEGQFGTRSQVEHYNSDGTIEICGAMYQSDPVKAGLPFRAWALARAREV